MIKNTIFKLEKFDLEFAFWYCWVFGLFNYVIHYDVIMQKVWCHILLILIVFNAINFEEMKI